MNDLKDCLIITRTPLSLVPYSDFRASRCNNKKRNLSDKTRLLLSREKRVWIPKTREVICSRKNTTRFVHTAQSKERSRRENDLKCTKASFKRCLSSNRPFTAPCRGRGDQRLEIKELEDAIFAMSLWKQIRRGIDDTFEHKYFH